MRRSILNRHWKRVCLILVLMVLSVLPASAKEAGKNVSVFTPAHGASGVQAKDEVSLTFRTKVKLASGEALTSAKADRVAALLEARTGKKIDTTYSWSPSKRKLTLKPRQPLPYQTEFILRLLPGTIKAADGKLNTTEEARFTSEPKEPEFSIATSPANLAQNVTADSLITLVFNKAIQLPSGKPITKSMWEKVIKITDRDQKKVKFEAFWDAKSMRVTLDPEGNLQASMRYTVTIAEKTLMDRQGVKNDSYSFTFTTATQQDQIPPAVTILPAHGSKGVALAANVTLQFGENVTAASGTELSNQEVAGMAVWKDERGGVVAHTATWNKQTRTITLRPKGKLGPYTTYTVSFPGNKVKDDAGNTNRAAQITFSTGGK